MQRIDALLADYGSSHRTRGNLACHVLGISLIVFGTLCLLHAIPLAGPWTASEALLGAAFLFYLSLDPALAVSVLAAAAALDLAARAVDRWPVGAVAFVLGWIFQAIGHSLYEKSSPAFLRNLVHLLIGPAYLVNEALHIRPSPRPPTPIDRARIT